MCDLNFTAQFLYFPLALFVTLDDSECKILHIEGSADQDMGFLAPVIQRTPVYSLKANVPTKVTPISVLFRLTMEGTDLPQQ